MAGDGGRQRRGRTDSGVVYNTKELFAALQRAKEVEDSLRNRVARVEDENATLRSRVDALRKATAPSVFKKVEGTEMSLGRTRRSLSPIGDSVGVPQSNFLPPAGRVQHIRPLGGTSGGRVPPLDSVGRVVELERQLSALDKKRVQEVARWRKKYDDLQEKRLKRGNNHEHSDDRTTSRSQLLSKSRVSRQSELLLQSQIADELRTEIQELREKNKQLVLENGLLCRRLEEVQATCFSQDKQKTEKDTSRKYRDLLDRSERKIEELQRTNLKLHSMLKEATFKLRSGSRATLVMDSLSLSTKHIT